MPSLKLLSTFAALALLGAWLVLFRPAYLGGSTSYISVVGKSMEPTFHGGDLAVVRKHADYQVGDIVAFDTADGRVIHRIIGGDGESGFKTQGDNRSTPDLWRPTSRQVIGELWFIVPNAGRLFHRANQPLPFGILLGVVGLTLATGGRKVRRRRAGRRMKMQNNRPTRLSGPGDELLGGALVVLAIVAAAAALVALLALRHDTHTSSLVERARYEHTAAFDYTASVQPSSLYPDGVITPAELVRPAVPDAAPGSPPQAAAIYSADPPVFDIRFAYALAAANGATDVAGEIGATLVIRAGEGGWEKIEPLLEPTPFTGPTATREVHLDVATVLAAIAQIEEETGYKPGEYQVETAFTVAVRGVAAGEALDETITESFSLAVAEGRVRPEALLVRSQPRATQQLVQEPATLRLLGLASLPVAPTRWASLAVAGLAGAGAAALAAVLFLGYGRGEAARIRARYGSMLVTVVEAGLPDQAQEIRLASIADLMKLAQKDGRMVLHQRLPGGEDLYFIQDGPVVYTHLVEPRRTPAIGAAERA